MFLNALFTTGKNWKRPECVSTKEWVQKVWHIYSLEYYLAMKRTTETFNHVNEYYEYYVESKKSDTKGYIRYCSIYMKF